MFTTGSPAPSSRFNMTAGKRRRFWGLELLLPSIIKKEIKAQLTSRR